MTPALVDRDVLVAFFFPPRLDMLLRRPTDRPQRLSGALWSATLASIREERDDLAISGKYSSGRGRCARRSRHIGRRADEVFVRKPTEILTEQATAVRAGRVEQQPGSGSSSSSSRDPDNGSWYIQDLCEALEKFGDSLEFMELLTLVNRMVSQRHLSEVVVGGAACSYFQQTPFPPMQRSFQGCMQAVLLDDQPADLHAVEKGVAGAFENPCSYSTVLPKELSDVYEGLKLSHDEALRLEEETRQQSNSHRQE
ncbi:hypothetical protein CRUP_031489 [Coryphaenoides rupestris]|nr:hypothetical protein CRUP_031489 [Coryphaenoides rupestris]